MSFEARRLVEEAPVFACLTPEARAFIVERLEPMTLAGGDVLIHQDDAADALFIVAMGRFRVSMTRDDGSRVVLAERGRGEVVGEMALISHEPRSATVTAIRDSAVLRMPAEAFVELVQRHPEALRELTTRVVQRLVESVQRSMPDSAVVTVAVVPLDPEPDVVALSERLHEAFDRLTGASSRATRSAAEKDLGDLDRVDADRLAAWFAVHEAGFDVVVHAADPEPNAWTDACVRQADLILLVASAARHAAVRPIEDVIAARRHQMPCRTELVLVHPPGTPDPRRTRDWLRARTVDRHHHVAVGRDDDVDRVARLLLGRGIGVVFSGGGARGFAAVGVLRALEELRVPIDAVGGASVGAIIAVGAARGQSADHLARLHRSAVVGTSPFDITYPAISLAAGRRITRHLRRSTDGLDLEDTWRNVFCVSTNLTRGAVEVHRSGPCWYAARASSSIPGVLPPMRSAAGDLLVDGGLLDNLPVATMRGEHPGITVVAVDVGRTHDLVAGSMRGDGVVSGWEVLLRRLDPARQAEPRLSIGRILMRLTELGAARPLDAGDVHVKPAVDPFGITDFRSFERLIEVGYVHALPTLEAWRASEAAPPYVAPART
jgi:NTE family protein